MQTSLSTARRCGRVVVASGGLFLLAVNSPVQGASVLTHRNDLGRTGQNTNEVILTPANVNTNSFGLLFACPVDGQIFAQPLYAPSLAIPGNGTHNVVFVATMHDSIYAFDADNGGLLWQVSLGTSAATPNNDFGNRYGAYHDIRPEVGIVGTPVIDLASQTIFLSAFTHEGTNYVHRIHALSILTGGEQSNSPVVVSASIPGNGVGSSGGVLPFDPVNNGLQRPALTLSGGILYVGYDGFADTDPYHGWILGFKESTLKLQTNYIFNTSPNSTVAAYGANAGEAGLWMAGNGLAVDGNSNLFFMVANGIFNATNAGGTEYGDSFMRLSTSNGLAVADYFTPHDQATLAANDSDLGSGGSVLLPDSAGSAAHPHLIVGAGKSGNIYLVDRDAMGHFNSANDNQIVQTVSGAIGGSFCTPAYFNNRLYYQAIGDNLKVLALTNGALSTSPLSQSSGTIGFPGASPSVSANGTNNAIVWVLDNGAVSSGTPTGPTVLHAYNAYNLAQELYNSTQAGTRDTASGAIKHTVPTVVNGKVYVAGASALSIYGNGSFLVSPVISPAGGIFTNSVTVSITDASPGAVIYYTLDGSTPTTNSLRYATPFVLSNSTTVTAEAVAPGAVNSPLAIATFVNSLEAPPVVTSIYPDGSVQFQATNELAFTIASRVGLTNLSVQLSATNLSGTGSSEVLTNGNGLTVSGSATNRFATAPLTSNTFYTVVIQAADANGPLTFTVSFDTVIPSYTWEAEDWDYNGGQFLDNPQTNAYAGLVATLNVDGYNPNNPSSGAYRPTPSSGSSGNLGNEVASDKPRVQYTTGQIDYDQGYNNGGSGLWGNYTRHYPAGRWNIFMRGAGWAASTESAVLFRGGINGTLLGQFNVPNTATAASTYQNYTWVPLVNSAGDLVEWDTDGSQQMLTVMTVQGNYNVNFYMLMPINPSYRPNPFVSNVSPNGTTTMFSPSNVFSFVANSVPGLASSNVVVTLNGVQAFGVSFSGSPYSLNVSVPVATNVIYTAVITLTDGYGSSTYTTSFATFSPNNYTWEAEDWDYNGAHFFDNPQVNAYAGLSGTAGVDANNTQGGGSAYRTSGTGNLGNEVAGDILRAQYASASANDYDVGWTAAGNWANYTRTYPAGPYYVYIRGASPNGQNDTASLYWVTSGIGTTTQQLGPKLGQFNVPLTGGWQNWTWAPLVNVDGSYALITNSGTVSTLRMNEDNGGFNANFFMLVPAGSVPLPPTISQLYPNGSSLFQRTNTLSFVVNSVVALSSNNVTVTLNGVVLNNLIFSGSPTNLQVSWPYLKPNTVYSVTIAVSSPDNVAALPLSYVFDTFSASYYTWEAEDWDYNGAYFFNNPQIDAYTGLSGTPGIDANNASGGTSAYRPSSTGDLGNEVAGDIRRAQYINANTNDYDIGYTTAGNWANYTRTYPAGVHNVYMRAASPNGQNDAASLWQVTSGVGTTTQALSPLGQFNVPLTGGWQTYTWVPLVNGSGNLLTITNSGTVSTLRVNEDNGGWNANFFLLVPIGFELNVTLNGGIVNISFPTQTNATYQIEYKLHLSDSSWAPLGSAVPGTGGIASVQDQAAGSGRFYRGVASGTQ